MSIDESKKIIKRTIQQKIIRVIIRRYTAMYIIRSFLKYLLFDYKLLYILIIALI
jgi:hypothetical protein